MHGEAGLGAEDQAAMWNGAGPHGLGRGREVDTLGAMQEGSGAYSGNSHVGSLFVIFRYLSGKRNKRKQTSQSYSNECSVLL